MFNLSKKLMVDCYADEDFVGLWVNENPQDSICARIRTGFVVTFANFPLLWMSKLQTIFSLSKQYSEYVALFRSVIALLPLRSLIKEVIDNLVIDSKRMKFVSS